MELNEVLEFIRYVHLFNSLSSSRLCIFERGDQFLDSERHPLPLKKWQDQAGNDRYTTEVLGQELTMLDSRGDSSGSSFENNNSGMSEEDVNQDNGEFSEEDIPF